MATRTITVHDRCTAPGCDRVLHSISEGERGTCSSCWVARMAPDTRAAMKKLIASALDGATDAEKGERVDAAFDALRGERERGNG